MAEIWFTSDLHFNHSNVIKYNDRPFETVEEMNDVLIQNWNNIVGRKDKVVMLGDFAWNNHKKFLDVLNGKIIFVIGNHDKSLNSIKAHHRVEKITHLEVVKINKMPITCCHYGMRVWPHSHYNAYHLYGHSHGGLKPFGKSFDVGVDSIYKILGEYRPINFEEVETIMSGLPDNFNYIKKQNTIDR